MQTFIQNLIIMQWGHIKLDIFVFDFVILITVKLSLPKN